MRKTKTETARGVDQTLTAMCRTPHGAPTDLMISLYPRSAQTLLDLLEDTLQPEGTPLYVITDLDNIRNLLTAHLQRVAQGR